MKKLQIVLNAILKRMLMLFVMLMFTQGLHMKTTALSVLEEWPATKSVSHTRNASALVDISVSLVPSRRPQRREPMPTCVRQAHIAHRVQQTRFPVHMAHLTPQHNYTSSTSVITVHRVVIVTPQVWLRHLKPSNIIDITWVFVVY